MIGISQSKEGRSLQVITKAQRKQRKYIISGSIMSSKHQKTIQKIRKTKGKIRLQKNKKEGFITIQHLHQLKILKERD